MNKKLVKGDSFESKICGVCAGLSNYFNIDVTIIRITIVILSLFHGSGLIIYLILAALMPDKNYN